MEYVLRGMGIDMREKAHQVYKTKSGLIVPSVTQIVSMLNKPVLVTWANKLGLQGIDVRKYVDIKAEIGTVAHRMILDYFLNQETDFSEYSRDVIDKAENSFLSFLEWTKNKEIKPLLVEESMVSELELFGGAFDFYGLVDGEKTLVDFKTGNGIYQEYFYQLAGYSILLEEAGMKVRRGMILNIPRTEDERFLVQSVTSFEREKKIFRHLLAIYWLEREAK